jgi:hypothetical protein
MSSQNKDLDQDPGHCVLLDGNTTLDKYLSFDNNKGVSLQNAL